MDSFWWLALISLAIVGFAVGYETGIIGLDVKTSEETPISDYGNWLISGEMGTGSEMSTGSSAPITFYLSIPEQKWKFWEYKVGVNIVLFGNSIGISSTLLNREVSLGALNNHISIGMEGLGQLTFTHQFNTSETYYVYSKFRINAPIFVLVGWAILSGLLPANGGLVPA